MDDFSNDIDSVESDYPKTNNNDRSSVQDPIKSASMEMIPK